nr:protein frg1 [Quercus suber]
MLDHSISEKLHWLSYRLVALIVGTASSDMVKALTFKGDKKVTKKRKRATEASNDAEAPQSKQLTTTIDAAPDDDENWVSADALSDIAGPILLVLPTTNPVMSLSVDQLGQVFAQPVENLVEGEPATAEPHDVRQVWIAHRVVGSEGDFTFKGHHGRYLGCDAVGALSAHREAMSPEETFRLAPSTAGGEVGGFEIRTMRKLFIGVQENVLRGDLEEAAVIRVRMQARFKPQHKVEKAEKVRSKISRKELEDEVGRRLEDDEVKKLKKARKEGNYHEIMLDVKVKGKHDKFA